MVPIAAAFRVFVDELPTVTSVGRRKSPERGMMCKLHVNKNLSDLTNNMTIVVKSFRLGSKHFMIRNVTTFAQTYFPQKFFCITFVNLIRW